MMHIDGLNKLIREYNKALGDLRAVEKKLLFKDITKLNVKMNKGLENHNWFSLSISEYIEECTKEIEMFKDTKSRVLQQASNIEKQVQTIETACIIRPIDFEDHKIMDITQFSDYFESYRLKEINTLVKDYQNIGDNYLKTIETQTFKTTTQGHEEMKIYYYYWERKIFNAINKMVIRALATNKALL
jgi:dynein heavy chain